MSEEMSEKEIINILSDEIVSLNVGYEKYDEAVKGLLDLYQKEKDKNKELERKWDEEKYLIKLAENELLGYSQGYEDRFNHNSTAVQQVIKGRESELHQLEKERLKKIISKLKIENEELDIAIEKYYSNIMDEISKHIYRDRELIKLQRIIKYQDEKIKRLEDKYVKDKKRN